MKYFTRRIGYTFGLIGLLVTIVNTVTLAGEMPLSQVIADPLVYMVFLLSLIMIISACSSHLIARVIQALVPAVAGTIGVFDTHDSVYGLGLLLIAYLISLKYGFPRKRPVLFTAAFAAYIFAIVYMAAYYESSSRKILVGIDTILYLFFILIISYLLYKDSIDRYILSARIDRKRIRQLRQKVDFYEGERRPFDLDERGLTPAEKRVVRVLVEYRANNVQIAQILGISRATVKAHLLRVYDKMGVDDRFSVIDLCRYNSWDED